MGLNKFAHMTLNEFKHLHHSFRHLNSTTSRDTTWFTSHHLQRRINAQGHAPISYDLVKLNYVLPVREQGECGSCWAFSSASAVEILLAMKNNHNNMGYLSVQQLVDCDRAQNEGCNGGFPEDAFTYIRDNGLMLEKDYSYIDGVS